MYGGEASASRRLTHGSASVTLSPGRTTGGHNCRWVGFFFVSGRRIAPGCGTQKACCARRRAKEHALKLGFAALPAHAQPHTWQLHDEGGSRGQPRRANPKLAHLSCGFLRRQRRVGRSRRRRRLRVRHPPSPQRLLDQTLHLHRVKVACAAPSLKRPRACKPPSATGWTRQTLFRLSGTFPFDPATPANLEQLSS